MDPIGKEGGALDASLETESSKNPDDPVGHGNPPMIRRFKSGQSGNRRGRPRGSKNRKTIVREIAEEMHPFTDQLGRRQRRSTLELILLALRNHMAEGNVRAFRAYKKFLEKYEPQVINSNVGCLVVPAEMTPEEWIAEQEELNKHRKPPPGYGR